MVDMSEVRSSNVHSIGHDGDSLYVRFKSGGLYRYPGVHVDHHDAMMDLHEAGTGDSRGVGAYFHRHVRHREFEKLE